MHLDVGGERLAVNQLGPDFALVESTANHLPGPANLSVTVDEALTVQPVILCPKASSPALCGSGSH
jgi:hypothetical protein